MPTMEQLIVSNRILNQQMLRTLGLNADTKSCRTTPKQQNTKEKKSRKETKNWIPDMAAEEDKDNVDTLVRKECRSEVQKSKKSFAYRIKPGSTANSSTNPAPSPVLSVQATVVITPLTKSAKRRIRKKAAHTASPSSEIHKLASPSDICHNSNDSQNDSSQTNTFDTASVETLDVTNSPTACVQPFTGFTAGQIEAARQSFIDAQNRKEAIIRLMRDKLINKDDLAIIEPVDREVLQAVSKRRQQEANEQQKAEQLKKFAAGRYPRRNDSRKNYHESSEDDEILDEGCDMCKKDYEGHNICPKHHDVLRHLDIAELEIRPQGYNAMRSLPEGLLVKESPIPGARRGVFTEQFTTLRKNMTYGPYEGVRVYNEREAHQSGYCWQIYTKRNISHWIDARQVRRSNWLRYINCAATTDQQNVCAYQVGQNIYYRTVVDIGPDTELLVWYGDDYARELGLHSMAFMASINSITINGVNLACWDCQLEFRCRQLLNQHKFTAHDTVNNNIVAVVGTTRCVTNTVATRQVRGSVAKSGLLAVKPCIAGFGYSAISVVAVSPFSTASDVSSYKMHESSAGSNDGFGTSCARLIYSALNQTQVTGCSGAAGLSLSDVQSSDDMSRVFVDTGDDPCFRCSTCCKLFETRTQLTQHTRIHTVDNPFECSNCCQRFTNNGDLTQHSRIHTGEKPFECTTCGQRFAQNNHLTRHSLIHTGEKPFECTTCGHRFALNGGLTEHSRIHTGERPFECTTCGQRFAQNSHLTRHIFIHTGERPFECTTCGQRFAQNNHLTRHSLIHTGEKPFECTTCGQRFALNGGLTEHSRIHTGERPFECTTCGQRFAQNNHLTRHSLIHTGEKPFECTTCGQRFAQNNHLTRHSLIHTGEKPFECTTCGQRFALNGGLTEHSRIHTGERPFECTTCGQRFAQNNHLTRHSLIHTGAKPFECTTCGQRFTRNGHLTQHSRIHTGERPFVCTTCGRWFALNGHLTRHSRIHTEEKQFECTTCGQRFALNGHLTRHSRIHTVEKPFECTPCGQGFTWNGDLTKHSRIHTGEKPYECATCGQMFTQSTHLARHRRMHAEGQ